MNIDKCECGEPLPNHLLGLSDPSRFACEFFHTCRCHRKYRGIEGGWQYVGLSLNRAIKLEPVKLPVKSGDYVAPPGHIFLCDACGKVSRTRYGLDGSAQHGWDESCMLNASLMKEATP